MKNLMLIIGVMLIFAVGCSSSPVEISTESKLIIYKAVITEAYFVDHSFQQPPMWSTIYVHRITEDLILEPDAPRSDSQLISNEIQQGLTTGLDNIPADIFWIGDASEASIDPQNGQILDGRGVILTLGNIHLQDDGSVWVSFWLQCGSLCGIGKTYVLEESNGGWQVTGSTGIDIMS